MSLHAKIRMLRLEMGLTLEDFAKKATLHYSHLSRVERGLIEPSLSTLNHIARVHHLTVSDLLENTEFGHTEETLSCK